MSQLAIKGHTTRGKEVIEILKMLGGVNDKCLHGVTTGLYYFIDYEEVCSCESVPDTYIIFTLEEFEEKYPYKVGDKVVLPEYKTEVPITQMKWNGYDIMYCVNTCYGNEWFTSEDLKDFNGYDLQPYKEQKTLQETIDKSIDKTNKVIFDTNAQCCDIMKYIIKEDMETITIDDFKANTKEWLIDKLESMSKDNALQTISNLYEELHKPKYPKTYKECCDILRIPNDERYIGIDVTLHYNSLLKSFTELLICRDAYWKIAGKEMGLDKPWKPDWYDEEQVKYLIGSWLGTIQCLEENYVSHPLAFPTEEMRDAFYENFKDLIKQCKELL